MAVLMPRRCKLLSAGLRGEEQLLQVGLGHPLQLSPLLNGEEHGGLDSALCHDLRALRDGGIEKFAES